MYRSRWTIGKTVVACLLLVGCAADTEAGPVAPAPESPGAAAPAAQDPVALVGSWRLAGVATERGGVLRIAADRIALWRKCGVVEGSWQADPSGLFIADLYEVNGCRPVGDPTPAWLGRVSAFDVDGASRRLLDVRGNTVARLLPGGKPPSVPAARYVDRSPPKVTDALRSAVKPATPLPPRLAAPARNALVGRWEPAGGRAATGPTPAHVDLRADGDWIGSDGCNGQGGRWAAGPAGAFVATSGPSTLIGCDNVNVGSWLEQARRAGLDGDALVLLDAQGRELGRLRRAS